MTTYTDGRKPAAKVPPFKRSLGKIDITPTWQGVLPYYLAVLEDGTEEGKRIAREELQNMARAADSFNKIQKGA